MFFFGRTVPNKKTNAKPTAAASSQGSHGEFNIDSVLQASRLRLTSSQQDRVAKLEKSVVRGNVKDQQAQVYKQLANFYRDSAHALVPYAYYITESAKLENSEKSLTFAAHFLLDGVRSQEDHGLKDWLALQAKELFEKALVLNPENDSSKVGLGSCYLFGHISETPMAGITMIREVAERKPDNMYAQMMLGVGGMISGQYDRAIERFTKVVQAQPGNPEAVVMLAEAYERKGDKANAIRWYDESKKIIGNEEILKEIDRRITDLKK